MKIMAAHGSCGKADTAEMLRSAACGFMLARGIGDAALSARWSLAAVTGGYGGGLPGALLFLAACGLVCVTKTSCGAKSAAAADWATAALCALRAALTGGGELWFAAETVPVIAALAICGGGKRRWLMLLIAVLFLPLEIMRVSSLRAEAICGMLSCAGICASSVSVICDSGRDIRTPWLIAGIAAGLL